MRIQAVHLRCALSVCRLYFKKMCQHKTFICLIAFWLFSQGGEQGDLKATEKEKTVVALPPKEASKYHREDLAEAFYVRIDFAFDVSCCEVFRFKRKQPKVLKTALDPGLSNIYIIIIRKCD